MLAYLRESLSRVWTQKITDLIKLNSSLETIFYAFLIQKELRKKKELLSTCRGEVEIKVVRFSGCILRLNLRLDLRLDLRLNLRLNQRLSLWLRLNLWLRLGGCLNIWSSLCGLIHLRLDHVVKVAQDWNFIWGCPPIRKTSMTGVSKQVWALHILPNLHLSSFAGACLWWVKGAISRRPTDVSVAILRGMSRISDVGQKAPRYFTTKKIFFKKICLSEQGYFQQTSCFHSHLICSYKECVPLCTEELS